MTFFRTNVNNNSSRRSSNLRSDDGLTLSAEEDVKENDSTTDSANDSASSDIDHNKKVKILRIDMERELQNTRNRLQRRLANLREDGIIGKNT